MRGQTGVVFCLELTDFESDDWLIGDHLRSRAEITESETRAWHAEDAAAMLTTPASGTI